MTPAQKEQLQSIVTLFDQAEAQVKEIERLSSDLAIPSINQLRYVGYHIARALCADAGSETIDTEITKAKNHCQRAIYDAHEVGIIYLLQSIKLFKVRNAQKAGSTLIIMPSYLEDLTQAEDAATFIDQINKNHHNERETYYEQARPHYEILRNIENKLTTAEPLILQDYEEKLIRDKRETRRFIVNISLAIAGTIIAAIIGILQYQNT